MYPLVPYDIFGNFFTWKNVTYNCYNGYAMQFRNCVRYSCGSRRSVVKINGSIGSLRICANFFIWKNVIYNCNNRYTLQICKELLNNKSGCTLDFVQNFISRRTSKNEFDKTQGCFCKNKSPISVRWTEEIRSGRHKVLAKCTPDYELFHSREHK
jgi:hypothetical protein